MCGEGAGDVTLPSKLVGGVRGKSTTTTKIEKWEEVGESALVCVCVYV